DYKDMLTSGKIDAVIVAVPHKFHADIAMEVLENNLNVLVEKPIDVSVTKAKVLNECAKNHNKVFAIMFNQRTNELFAQAKDILATGKLGKIKRSVWIVTNWYRTQSYYDSGSWRATWAGEGGGVLLNQAPHNLDLWQWICGMPSSVCAYCDTAKYHNIEVEDDVTIIAKYNNGAVGTFITTTGEFPGTNRLEISGTLGKIVIENGILKWWQLDMDEEEFRFASKESFAKIETNYQEILPKEKETAHAGILQNFTNAILFGEKLLSPGYDGINELAISNAAYLSEWTGNREIKIPFDNKEFDELLAKKAEKSNFHDTVVSEENTGEYQTRWQVRW
ncbi:MAG: Gfo/Idh/MocA family oxidoreductase, partial [Clostridia bacterium]